MKKIVTTLGLSSILIGSVALTPVSAEENTEIPKQSEQQLQEITEYQLSPELKAQADALVQQIAIETTQKEESLGISPKQLEAKRAEIAKSPRSAAVPDYSVEFWNLIHTNKKKSITIRNIASGMDYANGRAYMYYAFAQLVKSGGPWDYKVKYGYSNQYIFNNMRLTGEDFGNLHFGYQGKACGFTDFELKAGAGAYQIWSGTGQWEWIKTYFDDPNDQKWIQVGINYYGWGY